MPALLFWFAFSNGLAAEEPLTVLAKVGPWPEVSRLIGYDGRLWFANSVKGRNHNSADLYSYDPESGQTRYETQLFSQDAGRPLVAEGVLYWPFEDARFSLGWGHYVATDGQVWRQGTIPSARAFHTHAMAQLDGTLVAATSAWRAGLQVSNDNGVTWQSVYEHPTEEGRVSRIVELRSQGNYLIGRLAGRNLRGLLRFDGEQVVALPGWPNDDRVTALTSGRGWLYGLVQQSGNPVLWRSNGEVSERLGRIPADWRVSGLAADNENLWAVGVSNGQGWLWQSRAGKRWRAHSKLEGGRPREVATYAGQIFVAGAGDNGHGILWGPREPISIETEVTGKLAPPAAPIDGNWQDTAPSLQHNLAQSGSGGDQRARLRDMVFYLAKSAAPANALSPALADLAGTETVSLIGGAVEISRATLARWILLWGNGLAGRGEIPKDLLSRPWTTAPNPSEKYFDPQPIAIWAAGQVGQRDRHTISILIDRLFAASDPTWLKGDIVGALTRLTGQRFAHDYDAWRNWWKREKVTCPPQ